MIRKMQKGKYYLFYSANHFMSRDYAVGYAVADSPLGPWHKPANNPIIHRSTVGENGSGHGRKVGADARPHGRDPARLRQKKSLKFLGELFRRI